MQYLAMMTVTFENGTRIELYFDHDAPGLVTTDPYRATVRPLNEMIDMITQYFGGQYSNNGTVWTFEKVLVIDSGVL